MTRTRMTNTSATIGITSKRSNITIIFFVLNVVALFFAGTSTSTTITTTEAFIISLSPRRQQQQQQQQQKSKSVCISFSSSPCVISTRPGTTSSIIIIRTAATEKDDNNENENDINIGGGLKKNNLMKDINDLRRGDWIIAKRDVPTLKIRAGASYKLMDIYLKGGGITGIGGGDGTGVVSNAIINNNNNNDDDDNELSSSSSSSSSSSVDKSVDVATKNRGLGVEVIPLQRYGDDEENEDYDSYRRSSSYTKYLKIYNPRDHNNDDDINTIILNSNNNNSGGDGGGDGDGVIVTPEEIGLVTIKADWTEALYLAIPGFFWIFVASSFSSYYTDRYGGNFWDAFFRT